MGSRASSTASCAAMTARAFTSATDSCTRTNGSVATPRREIGVANSPGHAFQPFRTRQPATGALAAACAPAAGAAPSHFRPSRQTSRSKVLGARSSPAFACACGLYAAKWINVRFGAAAREIAAPSAFRAGVTVTASLAARLPRARVLIAAGRLPCGVRLVARDPRLAGPWIVVRTIARNMADATGASGGAGAIPSASESALPAFRLRSSPPPPPTCTHVRASPQRPCPCRRAW
jgi:hypothetical protein